jgi:CheY-like chemotaxis protein
MGALTKPIKTKDALDRTFNRMLSFTQPRTCRVLVIEGDAGKRAELSRLVGGDHTEVQSVENAIGAIERLTGGSNGDGDGTAAGEAFDLIVTAFDLPDRKGLDLIDEIKEQPALRNVPLIVYSDRELSKKEEIQLKRLTQTAVVRDVRSPERLVDAVALFLHRDIESMPEERQDMLRRLHHSDSVLANKKVLIVDDDIRNIFAMTSLLEPHQMKVVSAETGRAAIEALQEDAEIDVVLMDIMMPDMDGYDTMRAIRKLAKFRSLPIIALTAKAMKGDREKCIEAGASDYISKPVDTEQLLGMLRIWLYR